MNNVELAYLTIAKVRSMTTAELRQVQLEVNALLETPNDTAFAEEYRRLLNKCGKVLAERHADPQLPLVM